MFFVSFYWRVFGHLLTAFHFILATNSMPWSVSVSFNVIVVIVLRTFLSLLLFLFLHLREMAPRFKGLSQAEIEKLMNDSESENFADSDSDCELENLEDISFTENEDKGPSTSRGNELNINAVNSSFSKDENKKFDWKHPNENDNITLFSFEENVGLKSNFNDLQDEVDFFKLFFTDEVLSILCEETNRYAEDVLEARPEISGKRKHSIEWVPIEAKEMLKFIGLVLLMGHIDKDNILEYWSTDDLIETPIFRKVMSRDRFVMILKFLHFSDNNNKGSRDDPTYDRLWKIRKVFQLINESFKKVYKPTECLAIDEVIIKFKGRVIFRQYIPKKRKQWGIKVYKIVDETGYTYDMQVYLGKDKLAEKPSCSAAFNVVTNMAQNIKGKGHKLYMDNFFSSPELFEFLHREMKINSCGTIRSNRKNFPKDISNKKMKTGDIIARFSNGMTALCWKDKREVNMLSNLHKPQDQKTSEDKLKPEIVSDYNKHMGYVDLSDRMANSYSFGRRTLKWTKKLFFHLLDLSILNAYLVSKSNKGTHKDFRLKLIRQLIQISEFEKNSPSCLKSNMPLRTQEHWLLDGKKQRRCVNCSQKGLQKRSTIICQACNVALCIGTNCFKEYHCMISKE